MRIAFLGSGAFGLPTLQTLVARHHVVGVVTQPDRPAGRGKALTATPIGAWVGEHLAGVGVPLLKPVNVNEHGVMDTVRGWDCDAWVIIAFGQKLSEPLIEGRFAINLHASLLPRWRGAAPINAAMLAGDAETGNSVITIAQRMDAGLVLGQSRRVLDPMLTAGELHDVLAADGPALVQRVLEQHEAGTLLPVVQDEALVTKARKLSRADAWIDFRKPAEEARRRVHGLTPWPGMMLTIAGHEVKALRVDSQSGGVPAGVQPGVMFDAARGLVACGGERGGGVLRLVEVQPPGGKPMKWSDYVRGHTLSTGALVQAGTPPC